MALRSFGTSLAGTTTGGTGVKNGVTAPIDGTAAPRARFTRDPRLTSAQCGNIAPTHPATFPQGPGPPLPYLRGDWVHKRPGTLAAAPDSAEGPRNAGNHVWQGLGKREAPVLLVRVSSPWTLATIYQIPVDF